EISSHLCNNPLRLLIERHGTIHHVVEQGGDILAERRVRNGLSLPKYFVTSGCYLFGFGINEICCHKVSRCEDVGALSGLDGTKTGLQLCSLFGPKEKMIEQPGRKIDEAR